MQIRFSTCCAAQARASFLTSLYHVFLICKCGDDFASSSQGHSEDGGQYFIQRLQHSEGTAHPQLMLVDANLIYWVLSTGWASCYSIPPAFPQWILSQPFKADIAFILQMKKWTLGSQEAKSGFKTSAEPRGAFLTEAPYYLQPTTSFQTK